MAAGRKRGGGLNILCTRSLYHPSLRDGFGGPARPSFRTKSFPNHDPVRDFLLFRICHVNPAPADSRFADGVSPTTTTTTTTTPAELSVLTAVQLVRAVGAVIVPVAAPKREGAVPVPASELIGFAG